jgi:serine protease AprX
MSHDTDGTRERIAHGLKSSRRSVLKAAGAGAASLLGFSGTAAGASADTSTIDDALDLSAAGLNEVLVVFDSTDSVGRLAELDFEHDYPTDFHAYAELPIGYTFLSSAQVRTVADWEGVRRVKASEELEFYNDAESREAMAVDTVREDLGYDGSSVDAVVIDGGIDGSHPDFQGRLESNWQYVDEPLGERDPVWTDVGTADTDDLGHGNHCSGILAGDGAASDGQYTGMAPGATLSVYSTTQTVYLPYAIAAWDHMLGRKRDPEVDFDPVVVSNSYGVARGIRYNPNDPLNVASWAAYQEGMVPVFAYGNDGPGLGTSNRFAKAPHVIGVAATGKDKRVTDFSSRGRDLALDATEYDRERTLENISRYHAIQEDGQHLVQTGEFTGTLGPGVNSSPGTGGVDEETTTATHTLETFPNADLAELTLSMEPDGQWVRTTVYDESGSKIAVMGEEPLHQHRTLTFTVEGGEDYRIELDPEDAVAVDYTLEYETIDKLDASLSDVGPVTLFRPGVATHGLSVMSTFGATDGLQALSPDAEPFYGRISGTSMACPAAAGIGTLLIDAAQQNGHGTPTPVEVINTLEATALDAHTSYTPANAGPGFVDAAAAVARAEAGDFAGFAEVSLVDPDTPTFLDVAGSRSDDGSTFTAGQTDQIDVTVENVSHTAVVRDSVPAEWTVKTDFGDVERVEEVDGRKEVSLTGEVAPGDGETAFTYFVEAPATTGQYTFGPAAARAAATDDEWVAFGGTETNTVVGQST